MALNFSLDALFEPALLADDPWWVYLLGGAGWTIALMLASFALALALGIVVGTLRTSQHKFLSMICEVWIELFRNIPLIVQIFMWYFVIPEFIPWYKDWMNTVDPVYAQFMTAFICLGFFTSSRIAEQVRAGISSVPCGLPNAAKALGWKVMTPVFDGANEANRRVPAGSRPARRRQNDSLRRPHGDAVRQPRHRRVYVLPQAAPSRGR